MKIISKSKEKKKIQVKKLEPTPSSCPSIFAIDILPVICKIAVSRRKIKRNRKQMKKEGAGCLFISSLLPHTHHHCLTSTIYHGGSMNRGGGASLLSLSLPLLPALLVQGNQWQVDGERVRKDMWMSNFNQLVTSTCAWQSMSSLCTFPTQRFTVSLPTLPSLCITSNGIGGILTIYIY